MFILPSEAKIIPMLKGTIKRVPLLNRFMPRKTGGTINARYCYSVWLRHLIHFAKFSNNTVPGFIAELGPGDSPGVGLAALLSGAKKYYGLDVLRFWKPERNISMLKELTVLFKSRTNIPDDSEFPGVFPLLDDYSFPTHILNDEKLNLSLDEERISRIITELSDPERPSNEFIRYTIPWDDEKVIQAGTIDLILSQAVLGQVDKLEETYLSMNEWLRDGGIMSHTVDLTSHGYTRHWNGHWTLSERQWRIIRGGRVFAINRQPLSVHKDLMTKHNINILFENKRSGTNSLKREDLASEFRNMTIDDLETRGVYFIARKQPQTRELSNYSDMFNTYIIEPFLHTLKTHGMEDCFCINEKFHTYNQLSSKISSIRKAIRDSKNQSNNTGIITNDDLETYASIFAIWLEGRAYVPLNPLQPKERNLEIINQADIDLILDSSGSVSIPDVSSIMTSKLPHAETDIMPLNVDDDRLAYILFTSGSTGKPKGVQITRGNVGSFIKSFWEVGFHIDHKDRCLQSFDLTFDVSVQSFLIPLIRGACTYTIPHDQIKYSYVYGLLEDHKLTFGAMAPSMIRYLQPYFDEIFAPSMRYNILTAEASPLSLIDNWAKCIPNAEIFDFYGPTEATIYCTYYKYKRKGPNKNLNGMLSIGKPMNGLKAIIADADGKQLDRNQKGELCISGGQLSPGYWKNPEKNISSFFESEIDGVKQRFYKTGDLCILDDEGDILYSGRLDYQVKIQGHRIELGEIEHHARNVCNGNNCIASVFVNGTGNNEIALFIETEKADDTRILEDLKLKIPSYMIPSKIIALKEFPLNSNGKTDRNELKKMITL